MRKYIETKVDDRRYTPFSGAHFHIMYFMSFQMNVFDFEINVKRESLCR